MVGEGTAHDNVGMYSLAEITKSEKNQFRTINITEFLPTHPQAHRAFSLMESCVIKVNIIITINYIYPVKIITYIYPVKQ